MLLIRALIVGSLLSLGAHAGLVTSDTLRWCAADATGQGCNAGADFVPDVTALGPVSMMIGDWSANFSIATDLSGSAPAFTFPDPSVTLSFNGTFTCTVNPGCGDLGFDVVGVFDTPAVLPLAYNVTLAGSGPRIPPQWNITPGVPIGNFPLVFSPYRFSYSGSTGGSGVISNFVMSLDFGVPFGNLGETINISNFQISAQATPEATSALLLCSVLAGGLGARWLSRRKRG